MLKRVLFGGETGLSIPANVGLTLLRIFAGVSLLMGHGMAKIPPSEGLVNAAANIGFPAPSVFAWAAALSESLGGACLALGLFTRPAAFFIAFTMGTALLGVHRADPFQKQELAFLYFFIAIAHLFMGAGDWSLDRFLRK
jgi:putative oxidoreductase